MRDASADFKAAVRTAFEQCAVGQRYVFRRTFTEGDVSSFVGVTWDLNPFHSDEAFARASGFGRRIVPGLLTGSMLTHIGGMWGFLATEMRFEFVAPVYIGDTVTCEVTVVEKDEARRRVTCVVRCTNQDGQLVVSAGFSGFPVQPRLLPAPEREDGENQPR